MNYTYFVHIIYFKEMSSYHKYDINEPMEYNVSP